MPHYSDKFMQLNKQESTSLNLKQFEFKSFCKKSIYLTYIFINMTPTKIKEILGIYYQFQLSCRELKQALQQQSYARIQDYDNIAHEVLSIFVLNLIVNTYLKYQSRKDFRRKDAQTGAKLAAIILH